MCLDRGGQLFLSTDLDSGVLLQIRYLVFEREGFRSDRDAITNGVQEAVSCVNELKHVLEM